MRRKKTPDPSEPLIYPSDVFTEWKELDHSLPETTEFWFATDRYHWDENEEHVKAYLNQREETERLLDKFDIDFDEEKPLKVLYTGLYTNEETTCPHCRGFHRMYKEYSLVKANFTNGKCLYLKMLNNNEMCPKRDFVSQCKYVDCILAAEINLVQLNIQMLKEQFFDTDDKQVENSFIEAMKAIENVAQKNRKYLDEKDLH